MRGINNLDDYEDISSRGIWTPLPVAVGARRDYGRVANTGAACPPRRYIFRQRRQIDVDFEQGRIGSINTRYKGRLHAFAACVRDPFEPGDTSARGRTR